jgi:hypothetical protein
MKKISTAAAHRIGKIEGQRLTIQAITLIEPKKGGMRRSW